MAKEESCLNSKDKVKQHKQLEYLTYAGHLFRELKTC